MKSGKNSQQLFYELADFLGVSMIIDSVGVTGAGNINTDWGLTKVPMTVTVFSGHFNKTTLETTLLLAGPGDLGLLCVYEPAKELIDLIVLDRSKLPNRGKSLFETATPPVPDSSGAFVLVEDGVVTHFVGHTRGPFKRLDLIDSAEAVTA